MLRTWSWLNQQLMDHVLHDMYYMFSVISDKYDENSRILVLYVPFSLQTLWAERMEYLQIQ